MSIEGFQIENLFVASEAQEREIIAAYLLEHLDYGYIQHFSTMGESYAG